MELHHPLGSKRARLPSLVIHAYRKKDFYTFELQALTWARGTDCLARIVEWQRGTATQ